MLRQLVRRFCARSPAAVPHAFIERCACCGGTDFESQGVLWLKLVREWRLSPSEAAYIDRQQGTACLGCHPSLGAFARHRPTGGACCFTVPVVVGRTSRSRTGLRPSFHAAPHAKMADYRVETEYGADAWGHVIEAGFSECRIVAAEYPSALAFTAVRWRVPSKQKNPRHRRSPTLASGS